MCCSCSVEQKLQNNIESGFHCKISCLSFCLELEVEKLTSASDEEDLNRYCIFSSSTRKDCSVLENLRSSSTQQSCTLSIKLGTSLFYLQ